MKSNIAIGIIKPGGISVVSYLDLNLSNKGTNNCVPNIGPGLETGDVVSGWKDANTYWVAAIYNGGDPAVRANYTPLNEITMDYVCPVPTTSIPSGGSGTPPTGGGATTLPLLNFYYQGFWESADTIHDPEINSWVDYLDEFGVQYREMIGATENGCQLIQASSIVDTNGCATCTSGLLNYEVDNRNLFGITVFYIDENNVNQEILQQGDSIVIYTAVEATLSTQNDGVTVTVV